MINKMLTFPPRKNFCERPWMVVLTRFRFVVSFVLSLITSLGPAQPPPHQCWTFPLLPVQMGYSLLCGLWVWCRTKRQPCRPPLSNLSTPPRTTRPDGSGRWDNQMAAQYLPRYLGGLAVDKRTRSNEKRSHRYELFVSFRSLNFGFNTIRINPLLVIISSKLPAITNAIHKLLWVLQTIPNDN